MGNAITTQQTQPAPIAQDIYQQFIAYLDVKPKSAETYARSLKQFAKYLAAAGVSEPTRADVIAYRDMLTATRKPATVQAYMIAVRLFFEWTAQQGYYPNVAERVKGVKIDKAHKKDYLTAIQARKVLATIDQSAPNGHRDNALMLLLLTTGIRTIEAARANIDDLTVSGGHTVLYVQGKGRDERAEYVKIAPDVENAIRTYLTTRTTKGSAPLFASASNRNAGGRMSTRSISRIVKQRLKEAGYNSDRLTAHSLRHTAATLNLLNGGSLEETQQLLRHSSINTTMIYNHQLERARNDSESRIARAILTGGDV